MAPTPYMVNPNADCSEEPISRTYQYRKVMKPMLERKRRARINRCLDELKELMVTALQSEGENVSKLEKADILELTVRHLHNLKSQHQLILPQEQSYADRFRAGFTQCAQEVTHFIRAPADIIDPLAGRKLLQHLGACVRQLDSVSHQQQVYQNNPTVAASQQRQQALTPPSSPHRIEESNIIRLRNTSSNNVSMWRPW